ncbi:MAG: glutathione S-transferase [Cyanobacteria bacterium P01_G01_bin.54]
MQLYSHEISGNSYKVRLFLNLLGLDHEVITVDLAQGEHKQPAFLALNPFGQLPVLVDGDTVLADAAAILTYLARRYGGDDWLPIEPEPLSRVVRWLSTATGEIRQGPENARLYHLLGASSINIDRATEKAQTILALLNMHLRDRTWLEFERPTIADVAVFPYIALAPDGKIDLAPYPHVRAWLERVKALPGFVGMLGIEAPVAA